MSVKLHEHFWKWVARLNNQLRSRIAKAVRDRYFSDNLINESQDQTASSTEKKRKLKRHSQKKQTLSTILTEI